MKKNECSNITVSLCHYHNTNQNHSLILLFNPLILNLNMLRARNNQTHKTYKCVCNTDRPHSNTDFNVPFTSCHHFPLILL